MRVLFLLLFLIQAGSAFAEGYAVVVSRATALESMDVNTVRDVFLKKRNFGGDVRMVPVNPLGGEDARFAFEARVLNMNREALNRYWIGNHVQGISPPTTQASLASIKRFIEKVDGAIGYLPSEMVDSGLKVLYEF